MTMAPRARKAAFKHAVVMKRTTCNQAAAKMGVTYYHLSEGLANRRPLSIDLQQKFADFIGMPLDEVFPPKQAVAVAS